MSARAMPTHDYRPKQPVEVKRKKFDRSGFEWVAATVVKTKDGRGNGVYCECRDQVDFYQWSEVRPLQREERPASLKAPLTAVAGVSDLRQFVKPEAKPDVQRVVDVVVKTMAPHLARPLRSVPEPSTEPRGSVGTRITTEKHQEPVVKAAPTYIPEDLLPPIDKLQASKPPTRLAKPHRVTRCGEVFRRVRMQRALSQKTVGIALGIPDQYVSAIELGDKLPTDDQLLRFSEWSGYDLGDLEQKRASDEKQLRVHQPKEEPVQASLRPAPVPAPAVPYALEAPADFVDFLAVLKRVAPCPTDPTKRKQWMGAAEQLWELSQP